MAGEAGQMGQLLAPLLPSIVLDGLSGEASRLSWPLKQGAGLH